MNGSSIARGTFKFGGGIGTTMPTSDTAWKRPDSRPRTDRALILDGNTRSALAATRSLGRKGVHVVVAAETKRTLSGVSRFCRESFIYPSPASNLEGFLATVKKECLRHGIGVILPMTDLTTSTVLRHREELQSFKVPFAEFKAFDVLTNKWRLLKLAQQLNLSIPKTQFVRGTSSLGDACQALKFPAVLKPYCSMISSHGRWISTSVQYAQSVEELNKIAARYEYFSQHPFLIQEYISGRGEGVFALYDHGKPIAFFAHRRLRERPPEGGVSVLSESIEPNPEAQRMARALLDYVEWHGVAMVEFKVTAEGTPYIMEVNGRFWGSLQLAIDAGLDFPWLLYKLAIGKDLGEIQPYATGVKSRWLLGDFARLWKVLVNDGTNPSSLPFGKGQSILQFLSFSGKALRYEVNRWDDLRPFLLEVTQHLKGLGSRFTRRVVSPRTQLPDRS
jgi:predicted ATP-grasp superfamily ATP-dependent carboligase